MGTEIQKKGPDRNFDEEREGIIASKRGKRKIRGDQQAGEIVEVPKAEFTKLPADIERRIGDAVGRMPYSLQTFGRGSGQLLKVSAVNYLIDNAMSAVIAALGVSGKFKSGRIRDWARGEVEKIQVERLKQSGVTIRIDNFTKRRLLKYFIAANI